MPGPLLAYSARRRPCSELSGMPEAVVSRLYAEIVKALTAQDLRERLQKQSVTVVGSSPAELAAHVRTDLAHWMNVVKTTGIKVE